VGRRVKRKTLRFYELKRLEFANSKRLPARIRIGDRLMEWVGFGWIELDTDKADGTEVVVVEDDK
jgi:hypothetical protein